MRERSAPSAVERAGERRRIIAQAPQRAFGRKMAENEEISYWLVKRGGNVGIEAAKKLAEQSRLGWYVAPYRGRSYAVGKIQAGTMSTRHFLTDDSGKILTFDSVAEAQRFLREELKVPFAQVFDI
jgi:hypothetical protein